MNSTFDFPGRLGQTLEPEPKSCEIVRSKTTTPHFFVAGQCGSGKNFCLYDVIRDALERGDGITVIDPHGDHDENENSSTRSDSSESTR